MYTENICHFVPYNKDYHSLHTIHFVLETKLQAAGTMRLESVYKMYFVRSGRGVLHTNGASLEVAAGDIFFTLPAMSFRLESLEDFTYMYISFLGTRANMILEKLKIHDRNFLFRDCGELGEIWDGGLDKAEDVMDWVSEGVLLYTFSFLGNRILNREHTSSPDNQVALSVKKYIDDNFSDPSLSLDTISHALSYNKKYLSALFKNRLHIGIADYCNTVRIQYACTLIDRGFTSISDIAFCCGFGDPQYFSKVFKNKMSMTPTAYIREVKAEGQ